MDRRIIRTRQAIREAFLALRAQKPLEKIRVGELCEKAGINKSTFYAHYPDLYALAAAMEEELVQSILASAGQISPEDLRLRPEQLTRRLYEAFVDNERLVETLFTGGRKVLLVDRIEQGLMEMILREAPAYWDKPVRRVLLSFCVQGGFSAYKNNSGRLDDRTLVQTLGAISRAAQNIEALAGPQQKGDPSMYPTREEAERILAEAKARYDKVSKIHGRWDDHSRTAARCAEKIAARCPGLDPDKAYVLGLLHDIGRWYGDGHLCHVYYGWKYMTELGYGDAARICLTHSFQVQRLGAYVGSYDIPPEAVAELDAALAAVTYDDYDRLIQLCDTLAGPDGPVDMAARMEDVRRRYGDYPQDKWDKNFELRRYFERWGGADIYEMVGEMVR